MKRAFLIAFAIGVLTMTMAAIKVHHHRVVFDAATGEESWDGILNNVDNIRKEFGSERSDIEVVVHGKALGLVLKDGKVAYRVTKLAAEGVIFAACENTMRKQNVTRDALNPKATTVPSGVAEVVRKQEAGWSYVKAGG